ncbi:MAG: hypothetical protein CM15mP107_4850 [Bacteroidota bacterium]|nr:MAG: hypothetical protein CM15mP107_4850 [Bacteroidota bacterium]
MGNPYGIGEKFAVGGDGTGGYMAPHFLHLIKTLKYYFLSLSILLIMQLQHRKPFSLYHSIYVR